MNTPNHEGNGIDRLLERAFEDDLPPHVEDRMRDSLKTLQRRFRAEGELAEGPSASIARRPRRQRSLGLRFAYAFCVLILLPYVTVESVSKAATGRLLVDPIGRVVFRNEPDLYSRYKEFRYAKLHIPEEDLKVVPFADETKTKAAAFNALWADKSLQERAKGITAQPIYGITPEVSNSVPPELEPELVRFDLAALEPMMKAFADLVQSPDYSIDAVRGDTQTSVVPNLLAVQVLAKLHALKTKHLSDQGKYAEASATIDVAFKSARVDKYAPLISQLIAVAVAGISITGADFLLEKCDTPSVLHDSLARYIEQARGLQFIQPGIDPMTSDYIGGLRVAKRIAPEIEFPSLDGKTCKQIMALALEAQADLLRKGILKRTAMHDQEQEPTAEEIQNEIRNLHMYALTAGAAPRSHHEWFMKLLNPFHLPMVYCFTAPNFTEAATRNDVVLARFDLLRLKTAAKLYKLEHGQEIVAATDLVPQYLPEQLTDRFADDLRFYPTQPEIYSIGPDKQDDASSVSYDPTNGTISRGDVMLGKKEK